MEYIYNSENFVMGIRMTDFHSVLFFIDNMGMCEHIFSIQSIQRSRKLNLILLRIENFIFHDF